MPEGWQRQAIIGVLAALLVIGLVVGVLVGAAVRDDMKLDRIVRAVALDWRDFGEEKARTRLQYELDKQRIGMAVRDEDCRLFEAGETRVVECVWTANIELPGLGSPVPLDFSSRATVTAGGDLQ